MDFKRVVAIGSLIALLVTGCGSTSSPTPAPPTGGPATPPSASESASPGTVGDQSAWLADVKAKHTGETVNLLMASHPSTTAFQQTVKAFEDATGVKVNFDIYEEGAMLEKQLLECGRKSDAYDIYMTPVEGVTFSAQTGCEISLDDAIAKTPSFYGYNDLMPAYRDLFKVDGKEWAIPFAGETVFLMYRKDLFDKDGIAVPKTWDELAQAAKHFQDKGEVNGVVFRARSGWEFTYTYSVFLYPFGGMMIDPSTGKAAIDSPGSVAALDYMIKLKQYAPPGVESFSFPEAWQAMQTGTVAMAVEASAAAPEMEDPAKSAVAGKVGYAPLPAGPAGAYTGVWGWGLGINAYSKHQEAAWAVIAWLTGQQTAQQYLDAGGIPSRSSTLEDPADQAKYPFFAATLAALGQAGDLSAKGLGVVPKIATWNQVSDVIGNFASQAFIGQLSSGDAVKKMQTEIQTILDKAQ
jgi:ABC-type glycerol-3-phosphate transport system substrate-binding protein